MVDCCDGSKMGKSRRRFLVKIQYLVGKVLQRKVLITGLQSESVGSNSKTFCGYGADNEDVVTYLNDILFPFSNCN